jgi:hypothetical protein
VLKLLINGTAQHKILGIVYGKANLRSFQSICDRDITYFELFLVSADI